MQGGELAAAVRRHPVHWLAFGFGAGLAPRAPGTVGTLWGVALYAALGGLPLWQHLVVAAILFVSGIAICGHSANLLGVHDHPGIVWDEILGGYLTLLVVPPAWPWIVAGFVLFRFFDIVKPRPIRDLDHRLGGGLGIMIDDVVAALYAAAVLIVIQYFIGGSLVV